MRLGYCGHRFGYADFYSGKRTGILQKILRNWLASLFILSIGHWHWLRSSSTVVQSLELVHLRPSQSELLHPRVFAQLRKRIKPSRRIEHHSDTVVSLCAN